MRPFPNPAGIMPVSLAAGIGGRGCGAKATVIKIPVGGLPIGGPDTTMKRGTFATYRGAH